MKDANPRTTAMPDLLTLLFSLGATAGNLLLLWVMASIVERAWRALTKEDY